MSYSISMTPEDHGYQIRLMKQIEYVPKSEFIEVATIAIIDHLDDAEEVSRDLNRLIIVLIEEKIIDGDVFRYKR